MTSIIKPRIARAEEINIRQISYVDINTPIMTSIIKHELSL